MTNAAATAALAILAFGAAFHLYWAFGGRMGFGVSLPQQSCGKPVYAELLHLWRPAAFLVAVCLFAVAVLILIQQGWLNVDVDRRWTGAALLFGGVLMVARAVLPNRYVGLFKTARSTRWARYDSRLYSPLILLLGLALLYLGA